jgi:CBS domain-containing protein
MTDWRDRFRDERRYGPRGRRELIPAPWRSREDHQVERGFGEGEFERGGRPSGGYAQGGYDYAGEPHGRGYGSYGGGAYREHRSWAEGPRVREVMTPDVQVLHPDMSLRDAARRMRADNLGAYPVGEHDRLVGMVTDRDIVVRGVANDLPSSRAAVREVMSERVIYCYDDEDVGEIAELMAAHQVRRIPVLDRDKRLVGMLALADLGLSGREAARRALAGVSERTGSSRR